MTEVKEEVGAKAAAKGKEQEGSSLRADCSLCPPVVHPDGRRLALTVACFPDRGKEQDGSDKNTNFCRQHLICFLGVEGHVAFMYYLLIYFQYKTNVSLSK